MELSKLTSTAMMALLQALQFSRLGPLGLLIDAELRIQYFAATVTVLPVS